MAKDEIVEEVRRIREEYARKFNFDLQAIFRDLKAKEEEERKKGRKIVSFGPRPPRSVPPGTRS